MCRRGVCRFSEPESGVGGSTCPGPTSPSYRRPQAWHPAVAAKRGPRPWFPRETNLPARAIPTRAHAMSARRPQQQSGCGRPPRRAAVRLVGMTQQIQSAAPCRGERGPTPVGADTPQHMCTQSVPHRWAGRRVGWSSPPRPSPPAGRAGTPCGEARAGLLKR